jgi:aminopeptidase-like protein
MPTSPAELHAFVARLYVIRGRSITGPGLRQTLGEIGHAVGGCGVWRTHAVPSGTRLFDWMVPDEWTLRRAVCTTEAGDVLADTDVSDLHAINYSGPLDVTGRLGDLSRHVRTLPGQPRALPYVTSYYRPAAGVCMSEDARLKSLDATVRIAVDATLAPGRMDYGELSLPGESEDVVLLSAHGCHPQLANDNLASIACLIGLVRHLAMRRRHFTYRLVFAPGTIGALAWLAAYEAATRRVAAGLVVACAGDAGPLTYKRSRRGDTVGDKLMANLSADVRPFTPWDYDERQHNSPAFDLPVGRLTRTPNGEYPQYHTSGDDLRLVKPAALADTLVALIRWTDDIERAKPTPPANTFGQGDGPRRTDGRGEPQLGKHGLYDDAALRPALMWVLNLADGCHTPQQMSDRACVPLEQIEAALGRCRDAGLIQ